jgi:hypothetical protein
MWWSPEQNSGNEAYREAICRVSFGKYLTARLLVDLRDDITL